MPWLMATFYDWGMATTERACLARWRRDLLSDLHGRVLEVGAGTGASLDCYPPGLDELVLAEPDPSMHTKLERRARQRPNTRIVQASIETLGPDVGLFDAVFLSLVLCSVRRPADALAKLAGLLKPGGQLVFLEHVVARDHARRRWQRRAEPVWKRVMGNCHLTRDTEEEIRAAGFEFEMLERESMRRAIPLVRPTVRGRARKSQAPLAAEP